MMLSNLVSDIRYSLRVLSKQRGYTGFALAVRAISIGANAAIFGVADALLLRPLQFRDAGRLAEVWEDGSRMGFPENTPSAGNFGEWKKRNHVFGDMGALKNGIFAITGNGTPEQVEGSFMTQNLLPLLGVEPLLGRNFLSAEDREGGAKVAIINNSLWRNRYASDPAIIGKPIRLDGERYEIVGVMPAGFRFPERSSIWVPLALTPHQLQDFGDHYLRVFARLRPGVTVAEASREMANLARQLQREHPKENTDIGAFAVSLRDQLVGKLRLGLLVLCAGVGCVLLIACANLAGLTMARSVARGQELAVRAALGASRSRLLVQIVVESVLLSVAGGALGILVAAWGLPYLQHLVPLGLRGWAHPQLNWTLAAFTFLVSLGSAALTGLLPGLRSSRVDLSRALRENSRSSVGASTFTRQLLVTVEVALTTGLVLSALLLVQTLSALSHVKLGFNPSHVLTLRTNLPLSPESPYQEFSRRFHFYTAVLDKVKAIPGVQSAGYTTFLPLTNAGGTSGFIIEGEGLLPPGRFEDANHRAISDQYLQTMGVRLRQGRFFAASDGPDSRPVAIINEAMARQYFPNENPLGRRFRFSDPGSPWITIVGIVDDVRQMGLEVAGRAEMYFPCSQPAASFGYFTPRDLAVRVQGDPLRFAGEVRAAIWSVDRNEPISDIMPMTQLVSGKIAAQDMEVKLLSGFAIIAMLLASLGLYALLAYNIAQRTKEIGIRMALGAQKGQILWSFMTEGLTLTFAGAFGGFLCALLLQNLLSGLLYGVSAMNPLAWSATAIILLAVGTLASFLPARRAARIEPMEALRYQ